VLRVLVGWKDVNFTFDFDGECSELCGYGVVVVNSCVYGGGMYVVLDVELDDGLFDVILLR